jgi:hypothetical protein
LTKQDVPNSHVSEVLVGFYSAALKSTQPQNPETLTRRHPQTSVAGVSYYSAATCSLRLHHDLQLGSHALPVLNFTRRGPTIIGGPDTWAIETSRRGYRQYHKQHKQGGDFFARVPDFVVSQSPGKQG